MKSFRRLLPVLLLTAGIPCARADTGSPAEDLPDEKRILEISRMLPAKAGMVGFRPEDRPRWVELAKEKEGASFIKRGESVLGFPMPKTTAALYYDCRRTGNRTRYEKPYGDKTWNLTALLFAEALEQKGRFLPAAVRYIEDILGETSWVLPAHDLQLRAYRGEVYFIDLGCSGRMYLLSVAYALFRDRLPAGLPERIVAEIRRRGLDNYLEMAADPEKRRPYLMEWFFGTSNWNAVCNSRIVRTALNIFDDPLLRARFVEAVGRTTKYYLKSFSPDGYCSEGTGYWKYGYGHHLYMGLAVRAATGGGVDLFKDPINRKTMLYAYGARLSQNQGLPFADGAKGSRVDPGLYALGRQIWPDLVNTESMKDSFFNVDFDQFPLRAFGQEPARVKPTMDDLPPRTFFPDAQVFVMRAPWKSREEPGFVFAVKGGHNDELHNHNDVGSTALALGMEQFAGDPGGAVYTRHLFSARRYESMVLNSYGHPVPVVAGALQSKGAASAAKVLGTETSDARDTVSLDLTAAYPEAKDLESLVRTVVFDRGKRSVAVTDKVRFKAPGAFETPIVTYCDVISDYSPERLVIRGVRGRKIEVTVSVAKGGDWEWKTQLLPNPALVSPKRLAVALKKPVSEAEITVVYKALK